MQSTQGAGVVNTDDAHLYKNVKLMDDDPIMSKFTYDVFEKFRDTIDDTALALDEDQCIYFRFSADRIRDMLEEYDLLDLFDGVNFQTGGGTNISTHDTGYQCDVLLDIQKLARKYINKKYPNKFKLSEVWIDRRYNINFDFFVRV